MESLTFKQFMIQEGLWKRNQEKRQQRAAAEQLNKERIQEFDKRGPPTIVPISKIPPEQRNINEIATLYFEENIQLAPTPDGVPHMHLPTDDVVKYSSYTRARGRGANMGFSVGQWDKLKDSIVREGIKTPIDVQISPGAYVDFLHTGHIPSVNSQDVAPVSLMTGNNRVVIAQELGIAQLPIKFHYGDVIRKVSAVEY